MRKLTVAVVITLALLQPTPAHAGVKSALKKVAHVATRTVEGIAVVAAVIVFCSQGGCN